MPSREAFSRLRVRRVISRPGPPSPSPPLQVSNPLNRPRVIEQQLFQTRQGVFLDGATEQDARRWAQQWVNRYGGEVRRDPPHRRPGGGLGLPHFHIELPDGGRSGHIFWGTPPKGDFFD